MTTATLVPVHQRLDVDALVPGFGRAMSALDDAAIAEADRTGLDPVLRELVRLRASQLNGCAYCVDMHSRAARAAGGGQRVDAVAVWRESGLFTATERAALDLAEEVTLVATTHVREEGAAALLALLVTINAWNAIGVTARCWAVPVR